MSSELTAVIVEDFVELMDLELGLRNEVYHKDSLNKQNGKNRGMEPTVLKGQSRKFFLVLRVYISVSNVTAVYES
jgi:hypothetical protein